MMKISVAVAVLILAVPGLTPGSEETASEQLSLVRSRISTLERRLGELSAESENRQEQEELLNAELALAQARVREIELVREQTDREAEAVAGEAARLALDLENQRKLLQGHVELMALLGRPGTLQLFYDGARGGDLEGVIDTVAVLTAGQANLVREYNDLHRQRSARLAELSRVLSDSREEARVLAARQSELHEVQLKVAAQIRRIEQSQQEARTELEEFREREQALERLLQTLSERRSFAGADDIRTFRGALPWPVSGRIVQGFGKHYLPRYSTYTVCNGLRLDAQSGAEVRAVYPGEVAYARFFRGYGNMVVIDHGQNVYSLVAGLATIHVRVNQRVDMGLRLGLASPPSADGNTYFEIRVGKKPQDPRRWLQLEP